MKVGLGCWDERMSRHCTSGSPALIMVENCLVKITISLVLMPLEKRAISWGLTLSLVGTIRCLFRIMLAAALSAASNSPFLVVPLGSLPSQTNTDMAYLLSVPDTFRCCEGDDIICLSSSGSMDLPRASSRETNLRM